MVASRRGVRRVGREPRNSLDAAGGVVGGSRLELGRLRRSGEGQQAAGHPGRLDALAILPFGYPADKRRAGQEERKPLRTLPIASATASPSNSRSKRAPHRRGSPSSSRRRNREGRHAPPSSSRCARGPDENWTAWWSGASSRARSKARSSPPAGPGPSGHASRHGPRYARRMRSRAAALSPITSHSRGSSAGDMRSGTEGTAWRPPSR